MGVNHAYVTAIGRLIGVVALKELRAGIENVNSGNLPAPTPAPEDVEAATKHTAVVIATDQNDGNASEEDEDTDYSDTEMLPKEDQSLRFRTSTDNTKRKSSL